MAKLADAEWIKTTPRSACKDCIPNEFGNHLQTNSSEALLEFFQNCWRYSESPDCWTGNGYFKKSLHKWHSWPALNGMLGYQLLGALWAWLERLLIPLNPRRFICLWKGLAYPGCRRLLIVSDNYSNMNASNESSLHIWWQRIWAEKFSAKKKIQILWPMWHMSPLCNFLLHTQFKAKKYIMKRTPSQIHFWKKK